jgi:maltose-binding protein MalE
MKKITWMVASMLTLGMLTLTSCSEKTKDSANETVAEAKNDMEENVDEAKADIKEAGNDFEGRQSSLERRH